MLISPNKSDLRFVMIIFAFATCTSCESDLVVEDVLKRNTSIVLDGPKHDTVYLYDNYREKGATVVKFENNTPRCDSIIMVSNITGTVNTRLPGTYLMHYNANDTQGNPLPSVTRTVEVVENEAGFLNGNYNVACTCTTVTESTAQSKVSAENYTATITTGSNNHAFELVVLKIGPEFVVPNTTLTGNSIQVDYFSPDYARSSASGRLSPSKNSFTIESSFYPYAPLINYRCRSVFTKQLIEIKKQTLNHTK